jgi:hypothetical protein
MHAAARVRAPADLWSAIETSLDTKPRSLERERIVRTWPMRAAASLLLAAGVASLGAYMFGLRATGWAVERTGGVPVVGTSRLADRGTLTTGEWLETDASSSARLSVGRLGRADVGPGSRLKLLDAGGTEHRIALERGHLKATIWAPPRLFLVETPAARAVDLGCIYDLRVDANGDGVLSVLSGQVELERGSRRSLITAGSSAAMRPGIGPGTPYRSNESETFRRALAILDFEPIDSPARDSALAMLFRESTPASTITLWHLLPRVRFAERERVYEHLASIAPPPPRVTRDAIMRLDAKALTTWRRALEPTWSNDRVYLWKSAWRALWSFARGR